LLQPENISIVVPTKNEEKNISRFLSAIPVYFPLIAIDASDDLTPYLILAQGPASKKVIRYKGNISQARQLGAQVADTDWLLYTDADVVFSDQYFNHLSLNKDDDLYYGPKLSKNEFKNYYQWFSRGQRLAHKFGLPAVSGSNMIIKREALLSAGGFDPTLSCNEDSELAWRIKQNGGKLVFDKSLAVYATDHRRLYKGRFRKTLHSIFRCLCLFYDILPSKLRSHDWGYWSQDPNLSQPDSVI
jgi:glycosyltransferase involved in cell wall biosynthesis